MLADSIARLVQSAPRAARTPGANGWRTGPSLWADMVELGLPGIGVPEALGGFGASIADAAAVSAEVGRHLLLEPVLSTIVATSVLAASAENSTRRAVAAVLAGTSRAVLAHSEPELGFARFPLATRARQDSGGIRLSGAKSSVLDAPGADLLIVSAVGEDGEPGAYLVAADDPGLSFDAFEVVDGRKAADLVLSEVQGDALPGCDAQCLERALDVASICSCAEAAGAMEAVLPLCHDYLRTRKAFGQTLSTFQVLRHRFVDMHIATEEALAILAATVGDWPTNPVERAAAVATCKVIVCRAARFVGEQALHIHGGIGMTDEFIASHYYRRLIALEGIGGDPEYHLNAYAMGCQYEAAA